MKNKMLIFFMILFSSIGFIQANTPSRLETVKSYAKPISKIILGVGVVGFEFATFTYKYNPEDEIELKNPFPSYFKAINRYLDQAYSKSLFNGLSLISRYSAAIFLINQGISDLKALKKENTEIEATQRDESISNKFQDLFATLWNKIKQN